MKALKIGGIGCGGLIALIIFISVLSYALSDKSKTTAPPTKTVAASTVRKREARAYIAAHGADARRVKQTVGLAQAMIQAAKGAPSQSTIDEVATVAQEAHNVLDAIRANFATADDPGALGDAELNVFSGANDLKNSMGALVAAMGDSNAANIAHFNAQYANAVAEWDSGVRVIWRDAHRRHPPLV